MMLVLQFVQFGVYSEAHYPVCMLSRALPSLLDSEEEIMTTKYELSKMQ